MGATINSINTKNTTNTLPTYSWNEITWCASRPTA